MKHLAIQIYRTKLHHDNTMIHMASERISLESFTPELFQLLTPIALVRCSQGRRF